LILTSLLQQDDDDAGQQLQELRHDDGRRREEAVAGQRADVSDAEDERSVLDHEDRQTGVLQPPVDCWDTEGTPVIPEDTCTTCHT